MSQASTFVAAARSYLGVRWRHCGRKPWAIDCVGLVILSARAAGIQIWDAKVYGREPWDDLLRKRCVEECGDALTFAQAVPADIALIQFADEPSHVGIVADHPHGLSLIHAHNLLGVIEHRIDEVMARRIAAIYRPRWTDVRP